MGQLTYDLSHLKAFAVVNCTSEASFIQTAMDWRTTGGSDPANSLRHVVKVGLPRKPKNRGQWTDDYTDPNEHVNVIRFCVTITAFGQYSGTQRPCVEATRRGIA